jgi:PAS domain S-box-containing protein
VSSELDLHRHACAEAGVGVYEQDAQWRLTYVSDDLQRTLRTLLGRENAEFVGKDPRDTFFFSTNGPARDALKNAHATANGAPITFEFKVDGKNGAEVWFEGRESVLFDEVGNFAGCRGVFIDISRRRAAEAASEAKSRFMTAISHELRTPLNAILGYSEMILEEGGIEADAGAYLGKVIASARGLLGLIDDILLYAELDAGAANQTSVTPAILNDLLGEVAESASVRADERGNQIVVTPLVEHNAVAVDPAALRRYLTILMDNAVKFTSNGVIELSAQPSEGGGVCVRVRDSGVGFDSTLGAQLFSAFEQGEGGYARAAGGLGLGLALAAKLARSMGGRIEVSSQPGLGAEVALILR